MSNKILINLNIVRYMTYFSCKGRQSPINICTDELAPCPMKELKLVNYDDELPGKVTLENIGHTVSLKVATKCENERPYIKGALLKNEYVFHELHFHWGKTNNEGSEHTIDCESYPLEMHVVHRNKKYKLEQALQKEDGLSVIAVFFRIRQFDSCPLNHIIDHFKTIRCRGACTTIPNFSLCEYFPCDKNLLYSYLGSLTTPPHSEVVIWNIFPEPLPISCRQLEEFRTLQSNDKPLSGNHRSVQELNGRKVYKICDE